MWMILVLMRSNDKICVSVRAPAKTRRTLKASQYILYCMKMAHYKCNGFIACDETHHHDDVMIITSWLKYIVISLTIWNFVFKFPSKLRSTFFRYILYSIHCVELIDSWIFFLWSLFCTFPSFWMLFELPLRYNKIFEITWKCLRNCVANFWIENNLYAGKCFAWNVHCCVENLSILYIVASKTSLFIVIYAFACT